MNTVATGIQEAMDKFRFHEASTLIYQFIWHELCDWYIELVKPVLTDANIAPKPREERVQVLLHVMDYSLRMLHPFMPFITEEIWQKLPHEGPSIMIQSYPEARPILESPAESIAMQSLMDLISAIRTLRAEMHIDPKHELDAMILVRSEKDQNLVSQNMAKIKRLARLSDIQLVKSLPPKYLRGVCKIGEFGLNVYGALDVGKERNRLLKEISRTKEELDRILKKLNSSDFTSRAPEAVVMETRTRHDELLEKLRKLETSLDHLPTA